MDTSCVKIGPGQRLDFTTWQTAGCAQVFRKVPGWSFWLGESVSHSMVGLGMCSMFFCTGFLVEYGCNLYPEIGGFTSWASCLCKASGGVQPLGKAISKTGLWCGAGVNSAISWILRLSRVNAQSPWLCGVRGYIYLLVLAWPPATFGCRMGSAASWLL